MPASPANTPASAPPAIPPAPRRKRTLAGWLIRIGIITALLAAVILGVVGGTVLFTYYQMAGSYDLAKIGQIPSRSEVFDADGALYSRIESVNRAVVLLKDVSPWFKEAIVAREDERFYEHQGVDFTAIARAFVRDVSRHDKGRREGASTITQQLARNSFPLGVGRTLHRKLLEAMVAQRIERSYSKDQILECYVNRIYLGSGVYGVETAAQRYFGKASRDLTLGEAALLAGIVRSPNTNSPFRNQAGAIAERDGVLDRMVLLRKITAGQASAAKAEPLRLADAKSLPQQRDYLMDAVRAQLDDILASSDLELGGLRIYTTIDPHLQKAAERAVESRLERIEESRNYGHQTRASWLKTHLPQGSRGEDAAPESSPDYLQGALLAVDNQTGAIRAMVGGRNYGESSYNRALSAKRQIGSTFKPFVYAAAFQRGMVPTQLVEDSPLRPDEIKDAGPNWRPANSDGEFMGDQPADLGLIQSRNIMTIRIGEWVGRDYVRQIAQQAGLIDAKMSALPSLYLGAFETTMENVAGAYTAFPNGGQVRPPYFIERIDGAAGDPLYRASHEARRVFNPETTQITTQLLTRVLTEGTGKSAASLGLRIPAAGKTGTTNDYKDAWFSGYTTALTCTVWVGMDKPQTIMAKGYGAALALPIWVDFMQAAATSPSRRYPALAFSDTFAAPPRAMPVANGAPQPPSGASRGLQPFLPEAETAQDNSATSAATPPPLVAPTPINTPAPLLPLDANSRSPPEAGGRYIIDQRGQVVGIDGSAAAAREAQLQEQRRQEYLRQFPTHTAGRYQQPYEAGQVPPHTAGRYQPNYGFGTNPPHVAGRYEPFEATGAPSGPQPGTPPHALAVGPDPAASGATIRRAAPVNPAPSAVTSTRRQQKVTTRIYTLPDGTQVIQRRVQSPLEDE